MLVVKIFLLLASKTLIFPLFWCLNSIQYYFMTFWACLDGWLYEIGAEVGETHVILVDGGARH
jgi:hypothetical protein